MRSLEKVVMVIVCEGKGTEKSPYYLARYIYTESGEYLGEVDKPSEV